MSVKLSSGEWQKAQQIFEEILDCPKDQQSALLTELCGGNQQIHQAVMQLVDQDRELSTFLTEEAFQKLNNLINEDEIVADVGRYRLTEKLDQGGMGQIFLAERSDDEFEKQVVIKLIRQGFSNELTKAKFRHERQILANLEHPNIARLLDGGTLENGLPYVVMEYIEGERITDYCERKQLNLKQRIELFLKLCAAVEYAHQKLVIHRDIKPANVLVSGDGEPKLLDFGIATGEQMVTKDSDTLTISKSGTPGYASPEQLNGSTQYATSDVFSLGVLLYRLVVGRVPFDSSNLEELLELMRNPPLCMPVTGEIALTVGPSETEWRKLGRELNLIVQKALHYHPENRYQNCSDFALDLRRLLSQRPVSVYPSSAGYRLRKFAQRNQLPVALGVALIGLLSAFLISTVIQSKRLKAERDHAVSQQTKAEALSDLLLSAFDDADPAHNRGDQVSAREILDQSLKNIDQKLVDQPEARVELKSKISLVYGSLGLYQTALAVAEEVLAGWSASAPPGHPVLLRLQLNLAEILRESTSEFGRIIQLADEALMYLPFANQNDNSVRWRAMDLKANALGADGQTTEAIALYREIVAEQKRVLPAESPIVLSGEYELGTTLYSVGFEKEGEQLIRKVYERLDLDDLNQHQLNLRVSRRLARILSNNGEARSAEQMYQQIYQQTLQIYGDEHPLTGLLVNDLAQTYFWLGDLDQSRHYFQTYVELSEKFYGKIHMNVAFARHNFARALEEGFQQFDQAEQLYLEAIAIADQVYTNPHRNLGYFHRRLGRLYLKEERLDLARDHLKESLDNYLFVNSPKGRNIARARLLMAQVLYQMRDIEQASVYLSQALPVLEEHFSETDEYLKMARTLEEKLNRRNER